MRDKQFMSVQVWLSRRSIPRAQSIAVRRRLLPCVPSQTPVRSGLIVQPEKCCHLFWWLRQHSVICCDGFGQAALTATLKEVAEKTDNCCRT